MITAVSLLKLAFFKSYFPFLAAHKIKMGVFVSVTARMSRKISSSSEQKPDLGKPSQNLSIFLSRFSFLFSESSAACVLGAL